MKGSMSKNFRRALCALFAGALVITSVPTANVVAYADETDATVTTTSAAVKELTYNASDLVVNLAHKVEVDATDASKLSFKEQYAQMFYNIPKDVDMSKFEALTVEVDGAELILKLNDANDVWGGQTAFDETYQAKNSIAAEHIKADVDKSKFSAFCLMCDNPVDVTLGKITFKVTADATEETPEVTDPAEEQKPEVTEPTEEQKPETTPTEEKKPVTTKVTGKAITVTAGKTATIKMPIKKAKIKSVKYAKLSAKAAKVIKIDKKNNKVKGLKKGTATIKATITKKNGDKVVMTTKVTVKAAPKPTTPTTPTQEKKTEYTYDLSQLKVIMAWDATVSGNTITYPDQYKQVFFEIPAEVDMSRFISVTFDTDPSDICVKMGKKFAEGEYSDTVHNHANSNSNSFVWDSPDLDKSTGYTSGGKIEKKDVTWVDLMSTAKTVKTIKKVTFKLAP